MFGELDNYGDPMAVDVSDVGNVYVGILAVFTLFLAAAVLSTVCSKLKKT